MEMGRIGYGLIADKVAGALATKQTFLDIVCNQRMHKTNARTLRVSKLRRFKVAKPLGYEG